MRRFWLVPAMVAGAVLYAGLDLDAGLSTWWQLHGELSASQQRADAHRAEIERLKTAAEDLDGEFAMEEAIRRDLGLVRPGETRVDFTGSGPTSPWNP